MRVRRGLVIAVGAALTVLIRLRTFWTPITSDEGGFIAIARAWAHGDTLYRDVWVDRPQGLLLVFRVWDWVSGGSTASVRIMAMLFGVGLVVAVGIATTALAGRAAGGLAAVLVGITAASPAIEGHLANGELLSGAFAVGRVRVRLPGRTAPADGRGWLFVLSGVLGGCALSIKQSGYEGSLAIGLWLVHRRRSALAHPAGRCDGLARVLLGVADRHRRTGRPRRAHRVLALVVRVRRLPPRPTQRDRGRRLGPVLPHRTHRPAHDLAAARAHRARRRRRGGDAAPQLGAPGRDAMPAPPARPGLLWLWPIAATVAFATGGQFHRHYWITLCPGLSALAAGLLARRLRPAIAFGVALVALVPTYVNTFKILDTSDREFPIAASGDNRPNTDEHLAAWFLANRNPGDHLYVMCASASFYADAHEDPVYPYLWQDNVGKVAGALDQLRALLSSPTDAPRFVAIYEHPDTCDPSGRLDAVVTANYREFTVTGGIMILERISRTS